MRQWVDSSVVITGCWPLFFLSLIMFTIGLVVVPLSFLSLSPPNPNPFALFLTLQNFWTKLFCLAGNDWIRYSTWRQRKAFEENLGTRIPRRSSWFPAATSQCSTTKLKMFNFFFPIIVFHSTLVFVDFDMILLVFRVSLYLRFHLKKARQSILFHPSIVLTSLDIQLLVSYE